MRRGRFLAGILAIPCLAGCAGHYTSIAAGKAAIAAHPTAEVVGSGRYAYQFLLTDPHTGLPWPNHPYALTTTGHRGHTLPFVADEKNVYQGVSNASGHTAIFRLNAHLPDEAWDLRERFGSGPYGETFRITDGHDKPIADMPYLVMLCRVPLQYHRGYSYPNGDTAYAASPKPVALKLVDGFYSDSDDDLPKSCDDAAPSGAESDKP